MASNHKIFFPFFLLFLVVPTMTAAYNTAPKPVKKATDVVVEGVVYCQSCATHGTWGLAKATPIKAATVGVVCKDHRQRVSYYKACETDENGYFYAELKGFKMTNYFLDHPLHSCKVKLVSSPLKTCNVLTNVNYGLYGAPLRYEEKKIIGANYDAIVYAAGPLAFRRGNCAPVEDDDDVPLLG